MGQAPDPSREGPVPPPEPTPPGGFGHTDSPPGLAAESATALTGASLITADTAGHIPSAS